MICGVMLFGNDLLIQISRGAKDSLYNFAATSVKRIKYHISRAIVLLVALQILNVSVDIDQVVFSGSWLKSAGHVDDIDSFAELVIEQLTGDNTLMAENSNDDHHPFHKEINKFSSSVVLSTLKETTGLLSLFQPSLQIKTIPHYIDFKAEDFSSLYSPPPEHLPGSC